MKRILVILLLVQLWTIGVFAQEVHNSQYYSMPLYLNPANAGNSYFDFRGAVDVRNQWSTASVPFTAQYLYGDIKRATYFMEESWAGIGVSFMNDIAGDGLKSIYGAVTGAFHKAVSRGNDVIWSNGVTLMLVNRSVDYQALLTDDMWDEYANTFRKQAMTGEYGRGIKSFFYVDLSIGSKLTYYDAKDSYSFGVSISHLMQPNESFYRYEVTNNLARKFTLHGDMRKSLMSGGEFFLNSSFVVDFQDSGVYALVGSNIERPYNYTKTKSFILGLWFRSTLDLIPSAGMEFNNYKIMASYDIPFSDKAYKNRGGFEISLTYTTGYMNPVEQICKYKYLKPVKHNKGSIPCPKFKTGN